MVLLLIKGKEQIPEKTRAAFFNQLDLIIDWNWSLYMTPWVFCPSKFSPMGYSCFLPHLQLVYFPFDFSLLPVDDKLEQQHSLFTRYKDPCRLGPGEDKSWAIGKV